MTNDPNSRTAEERARQAGVQDQAKVAGAKAQGEEGEGEGEEEYTDEGAFPGQNPGRAVILPSDPAGDLDLQGYVEGRLPGEEPEATPQQ